MFHTYVRKFDVTGTVWIFLETKRAQSEISLEVISATEWSDNRIAAAPVLQKAKSSMQNMAGISNSDIYYG